MRGAAFNWAVSVSCVLGEVQSLPWTHSAGSALDPRRTALARPPRGWRCGRCWERTQMSCAGSCSRSPPSIRTPACARLYIEVMESWPATTASAPLLKVGIYPSFCWKSRDPCLCWESRERYASMIADLKQEMQKAAYLASGPLSGQSNQLELTMDYAVCTLRCSASPLTQRGPWLYFFISEDMEVEGVRNIVEFRIQPPPPLAGC